MSGTIKTVALCTATGKFGPVLLNALLKEGFSVTVISRQSSKSTSFPSDVAVRTVSDAYTTPELTDAFRGLDVVVLCLPFALLPSATRFAEASLAAGNRWLVASTYAANLFDKNYELFPASGPHRAAVGDLTRMGKEQEKWKWTAISCGPWVETAVASSAWQISAPSKTATLLDNGSNIFSSSTRRQTALAVARVLSRTPALAANNSIYISSFETSMSSVVDVYKLLGGSEGWKVDSMSSTEQIERSQAALAKGDFPAGYKGLALVVSTAAGYGNRFSELEGYANEVLGLEEEDLVETGDTLGEGE
ncbi:hypothetical protein ANO11243_094230 [Dothideomycetidae sp. 11243]|nr:hypothetical protein ANO11243_094230 [fungal sp. No.11243]